MNPPADDRFARTDDLMLLALHGAQLGAWEADLATGENHWHAGMAQLLGVAPESADAESKRFLEYIHPHDRANVLAAFEDARRNVEPGRQWDADFRVLRADGVQRWFNSRGMVVMRGDGRTCMVGVAQDITERKLWEERIAEQAKLIELSSDAIVVRTPEGRIISWNQGAEEIYGYRREEAIGQVMHLLLQTGFPQSLGSIEQLLEHDGRWSGELVHTRRDGTRMVAQTRWVLDRGGGGRSARVLETNTDITDRKEAERRLRESEATLRNADRRKDEFLATLAHELRNPLAPIRNAAQLLRQQPRLEEARQRAVVEMLDRQVRQMVRLIDDLLEVGRITTGKIRLERERLDLRSAIEHAIEAMQPGEMHRFSTALPDRPIPVDGDPARLTQVFSNLLGNAVKYTPKGNGISIEAAVSEREAVVRVRDQGIGLSSDELPRLFEMFGQLRPNRQSGHTGLGVGLALARIFVELHGGSIRARSEGPGKGSEFVVTLPLAQ